MPRQFFNPPLEQTDIVLIDVKTAAAAVSEKTRADRGRMEVSSEL